MCVFFFLSFPFFSFLGKLKPSSQFGVKSFQSGTLTDGLVDDLSPSSRWANKPLMIIDCAGWLWPLWWDKCSDCAHTVE